MTLDKVIRQIQDDLPSYGTISMTLKTAHDEITTVDATRISSRKVANNAQALTLIGSLLKLLAENKETGELTFTVTLIKGTSDRLLTHDFRRVNL